MKNKLITLLFVCSLIIPQMSYAQIPFGGRIVAMHECFCSGGWMFYVMDETTKSVLPIVFQFGVSFLRANYNIFTFGVQTLGSYTPGGICLMVSFECAGPQPIGTVTPLLPIPFPGVGTTLIPS